MIVGMLSDAHGNVEGFLTGVGLLRRLGVENIYFLGDAVGYLPGAAVVEAILAEGVKPISGNHEAMLLSREQTAGDDILRLREARRELGPAGMRFVAAWPRQRLLATDVGPALLVHDSPLGGSRYIYPDTDLTGLGPLPWAIVCMGHTHRAFIRRVGPTTYLNVGSCGLPRDDGSLGAVATLDTATGEARIVRFDLRTETRRALDRVGPVHRLVRASIERRGHPHESARARLVGNESGPRHG